MPADVASLKADNPVVVLEKKLKAWMIAQPEWLHIVNMPRPARRAAMKELAARLYTIPVMDGVNTAPRQLRRKVAKQLAHASATGQASELVREAVQRELDAEVARLHELEAEVDEATFKGSVPVVGEVVEDEDTDVQAGSDDAVPDSGSDPADSVGGE